MKVIGSTFDGSQRHRKEYIHVDAFHWEKIFKWTASSLAYKSRNEVNVNNYDKTLMKAWGANLKVKFETNVYSGMYLTSYVSKVEKIIWMCLKSCQQIFKNLGAKQSMKSVAHKFFIHREVRAQEAVYRVYHFN